MRGKGLAWSAVGLVAAALLLLAAILIRQALDLNGSGLSTSERASILQALAAGGALAGTAALIGVTAYYAWLTSRILESGRPRISAELKQVWIGAGDCLTLPLAQGVSRTPPAPSYPRLSFGIEVTNDGGAAATVEILAIRMDKGVTYMKPPTPIGGAPGPFRLEPYSAKAFLIDSQPVVEAIKDHGLSWEIVGVVTLGAGKPVRTKSVTLRFAD